MRLTKNEIDLDSKLHNFQVITVKQSVKMVEWRKQDFKSN